MAESGKPAARHPGWSPDSMVGESGSPIEAARRSAQLVRTIEGEIIPRLLMSLSGSLAAAWKERHCTAVELAEFALATEQVAAARSFDQLLAGLHRLEAAIHQVKPVDPGR